MKKTTGDWLIDLDHCRLTHTSGFTVLFAESDLIAGATVGEIAARPNHEIDVIALLKEAGTIYAASRTSLN